MKFTQDAERSIVKCFVRDALKAGFRLAVSLERGYDLDDMVIGSRDRTRILEAATAGDECHIFIQPVSGPTIEEGRIVSIGWVYFVFGNDGWDVISDYTMSIESILKNALELSDKWEAKL